MPENVEVYSVNRNDGKAQTISIATERELLEFCNKVRKAGGADIIKALFPSVPSDPSKCLIARNLNFSCSVTGSDYPLKWVGVNDIKKNSRRVISHANGDYVWVMQVQYGDKWDSEEKAAQIGEELNLPVLYNEILLPLEIGNAAWAFDEGAAFTDFVEG